ncbi:unnamed protein product [Pedinophyceae sp. YPF-701]|nr:unnamed protein product [Pedinophyceae sp. YPF-701]
MGSLAKERLFAALLLACVCFSVALRAPEKDRDLFMVRTVDRLSRSTLGHVGEILRGGPNAHAARTRELGSLRALVRRDLAGFAEEQRNGTAGWRIWNGGDAPRGRYPYAVSLRDQSGNHLCGGTLVTSELVVTAAHCVHEETGLIDGVEEIVAWCGWYDVNDDPSQFQKIPSSRVAIHPAFDSSTAEFDIAAVHLQTPCNQRPVAAATDPGMPNDGHVVTVLGWGRTETGRRADRLNHVDIMVTGDAACNSPQAWDGAITPAMFCAGGGIFDSCDGDSGGPAVIAGTAAANDVLAGVVSWGKAVRCGEPGKPGVYTKLSDPAIRSFLEQEANAAAPAPQDTIGLVASALAAMEAASDRDADPIPPASGGVPGGVESASAGPPDEAPGGYAALVAEVNAALARSPGLSAPDVPGFASFRGKDITTSARGFDQPCAESIWPNGCQVLGDAQRLAELCRQYSWCSAFSWLPEGFGARTESVGFLRGGFGWTTDAMVRNTYAATYVRQDPTSQAQDTPPAAWPESWFRSGAPRAGPAASDAPRGPGGERGA